jgi:hypothetical protein
MEYQVSNLPSSTTPNLISLQSSNPPTVLFEATQSRLDANDYTVTVQARFASQTTWLTSATATFKYINPCSTATISGTSHPPINT